MEIGTVITTTVKNAKASECLKCGLCEQICPQHLHIRDLLVEVAQTFKKIKEPKREIVTISLFR